LVVKTLQQPLSPLYGHREGPHCLLAGMIKSYPKMHY